MSSLAVFLKLQGKEVSGSDLVESENLKILKKFDITYEIGHKVRHISSFNPNVVVINYAIHNDNEQLIWAKAHKKRIITRAELLGKVSKNFKNVIAISGTHGKTTTTALISEIFIEANLKPTVHIGGILKINNSNFLIGEKKYFITEACEYKNSFHSLKPSFGAVLNIEPDHLDFFKNKSEIQKSFDVFLENSKVKVYPKGEFVYVVKKDQQQEIRYYAKNISKTDLGYSFNVLENETNLGKFNTKFGGDHNVKNALVAIAISRHYKVKIHTIKKAIASYHGVKRRFERIGMIGSTIVIHDYAHHPTEIKKVIFQAKDYGKVLAVFQPHTFTRTKKLFSQFTTAFEECDGLILVKTYPAREEEILSATAKALYFAISKLYSSPANSENSSDTNLNSNKLYESLSDLNLDADISQDIQKNNSKREHICEKYKNDYADNKNIEKNSIIDKVNMEKEKDDLSKNNKPNDESNLSKGNRLNNESNLSKDINLNKDFDSKLKDIKDDLQAKNEQQKPKYMHYSDNFNDVKFEILKRIEDYDCILIMGAGDIDSLAKELFDKS